MLHAERPLLYIVDVSVWRDCCCLLLLLSLGGEGHALAQGAAWWSETDRKIDLNDEKIRF